VPKKPKPPRGPQLELAGDLGVAFVNTFSARDWNFQLGFETYAELVTWGQRAGVLDAGAAERLRQLAAERPADADATVARAVELRKNLFRVFVSIARKEDPQPAHLDVLNAALTTSLPALRVVPGESGLTWGWGGGEDALDRMLWAPAHAAAELLISLDDKTYLRQCARKGCTLFFVSHLSRRRWCGAVCRNRTKSLAYYFRHERARREQGFRDGGLWRHKRPRERKFS